MNEAGQSKRLIVLDHDYQQIEEIHLDVGPRHFYIEGGDAVCKLQLPGADSKHCLAVSCAAAHLTHCSQSCILCCMQRRVQL